MIDTLPASIRRRSLVAATRAVAALEFGILAPVMALLLIGVFDLAKVTVLWGQVWSASRSIAESASTLALPVTPGGANQLTWQNANLALSVTYAEIPWVAAGIATGASTVTPGSSGGPMTSVLSLVNYMSPGTGPTGCSTASVLCCPASSATYCAEVAWSKAYVNTGFNSSTNVLRPCGSALSASATDSPIQAVTTAVALNKITVQDPFFVADVSLTYTPFFFNFITGSVTLSATSYVPVRTSNLVTTSANLAGVPVQSVTLVEDGDPNAGAACIAPTPVG